MDLLLHTKIIIKLFKTHSLQELIVSYAADRPDQKAVMNAVRFIPM